MCSWCFLERFPCNSISASNGKPPDPLGRVVNPIYTQTRIWIVPRLNQLLAGDWVYQQQQRPAEMASSCSSVIFGSGGNATCTVCMSLSCTMIVIESGIVMPNSPLIVVFGLSISCCLKSASKADLSTICFSISSPLLIATLLYYV